MKREIEAERFSLAAPCAPYGILGGSLRAYWGGRLRTIGSLPSAAPADEHDDGTVGHHSAASRPRLFSKRHSLLGNFLS